MRYIAIFLLSVFLVNNCHSQIYEIGLFAGGSNFIGDVGATNYISPNKPAIGGIIKWNQSPRHSFRASFIFSELEGIDANSHDPRRTQRNYEFESKIKEFSLGMEFTFVEFNLHKPGFKSTPYLYTGFTTANHENFYYNLNGIKLSEYTSSWAYGIPMVVGYKATLTDHFIIAAEIGARYTFTDEIDGSVPDAPSRKPLSFGNLNSNDWYVFSGLTLTYTFGQKPCYCSY